MVDLWRKLGPLDIENLIVNKVLMVGKEKEIKIPMSIYTPIVWNQRVESFHKKCVYFGQFNNWLNGIGRLISKDAILEGQFKGGYLNGWGRCINVKGHYLTGWF